MDDRRGPRPAAGSEALGPPSKAGPPGPTHDAKALHAARLAGLALGYWGLKDCRLRPLGLGFKEIFSVETGSGERFVLRMYNLPRGEEPGVPDPRFGVGAGLRRPETLRSQLDWVSALGRDTALRVPEPVPAKDGSLVRHLPEPPRSRWLPRRPFGRRDARGEAGGRNCVLLRWVPGEERTDPTPVDLSLVGAYVAGLHAHAEGYGVPSGSALPRWGWDWPFGESAPLWDGGERFYSTGEMEVFRATARRVREDLEHLGEGRASFGLVHRDLKFGNLVFEGGTVGALDFDLCGLGHYLQDLWMLRFSLGFRGGGNAEPLWAAFLEAYGLERSLPEGYRRYFATFAAMQRVASVNRQLDLLGSEDASRRPPRYLKNAVAWLERGYLEKG